MSAKGHKWTEEQKKKFRRPKSESHRKHISEGRKGYKPKEESIEKWKKSMEKAGYDHRRTEEYREMMSKAMKGKKKPSVAMKMREYMKGRPYNNYKRGFYDSSKAGRVFYRSSLELKAYIILDDENAVLSYKQEPYQILYIFKGEKRRYMPDVEVLYSDGSKSLIEVKPENELEWKINTAKFSAARSFCEKRQMVFEIMTNVYLEEAIAKRDELLETLNFYLEKKDNQQPSSSNESKDVDEKVQRLIGENDSINNPDTSVPNLMLVT